MRHGERQVRRREPVEPEPGALGKQLPYLDVVSLAGALLVAAPGVAVEQPRLARPLAEQRRDRRLVGELRAVVGEHGAEDPTHAVGAQRRAHAPERGRHARGVLRRQRQVELEPAGAVEQRQDARGVRARALDGVHLPGRGALGFSTPARAFRAMLGNDAAALLDAYGVEEVALGELDLTPGLIERARAERGDAPLA